MPSLFLSAATATRSTEWTLRPKLEAPTIQVSQISFVFRFVKPVRLKRLARFWAFLAPIVLAEGRTPSPGSLSPAPRAASVVVERRAIGPGGFSSTPGEKAPGNGAWFWWVVGPVSWRSAPLAARL